MTSPVSMPAGHEIVAADLDAYENLTSAPTAYTPTWTTSGTAPSIGNGTLTGGYTQAGKLILFRITLVVGSTTTFGTGGWSITLPTSVAQPTFVDYGWSGTAVDSGTNTYAVFGVFSGPNLVDVATNGNPRAVITATAPFTWTTSDRLFISGWYWAA